MKKKPLPFREERIFLKKNFVPVFKETIISGSKLRLTKGSSEIEKNVIFVDDYIVFEPAYLFEGGQGTEYVANNSSKKTVKYVVVKSKYIGKFQEVLIHYLKLTGQKYKQSLVKQFILLRNNVILIKVGKCALKGMPMNLSLDLKEIKAQLDAAFGKVTDPTINKVMVRGKLKQIQRQL